MNNDLISRSGLKKTLKSNCTPEICHDYGTNWCESCCPHNDFEDLIDNAPTIPNEYMRGYEAADMEYKRPQGEFTDLEQTVIADAINYLLGAELREENGYTEEVINALKSVLQKLGTEENHL